MKVLHLIVAADGQLRISVSKAAAEVWRADDEEYFNIVLTTNQERGFKEALRKARNTRRRIQYDNERTGINF